MTLALCDFCFSERTTRAINSLNTDPAGRNPVGPLDGGRLGVHIFDLDSSEKVTAIGSSMWCNVVNTEMIRVLSDDTEQQSWIYGL